MAFTLVKFANYPEYTTPINGLLYLKTDATHRRNASVVQVC